MEMLGKTNKVAYIVNAKKKINQKTTILRVFITSLQLVLDWLLKIILIELQLVIRNE